MSRDRQPAASLCSCLRDGPPFLLAPNFQPGKMEMNRTSNLKCCRKRLRRPTIELPPPPVISVIPILRDRRWSATQDFALILIIETPPIGRQASIFMFLPDSKLGMLQEPVTPFPIRFKTLASKLLFFLPMTSLPPILIASMSLFSAFGPTPFGPS